MAYSKYKQIYLERWLQALRYHFTAPSFIAALLGSSIAINTNNYFNISNFILMIIAILFNHFALNMTDDYYDYLHNVDVLDPNNKKSLYHGGSGVLIEHKISPTSIKIAFYSCFAVTIIIGLYFAYTINLLILLFGIIGFFCSYYYTAPPISFGYKGFGELAILFNFGPLITIGSFYLQTQTIPLSTVIISLPLGLLMFAMIIFNEIPDYTTDLLAHKKTLVVLFGKKTGFKLAISAIIAAYIIIIISAIFNYTTKIALITLITIPIAYKASKLLKNTLQQAVSLGQLEMIKTHNNIGLLLIMSYLLENLIYNKNYLNIVIISIVTILLYIPIIKIIKCSCNHH